MKIIYRQAPPESEIPRPLQSRIYAEQVIGDVVASWGIYRTRNLGWSKKLAPEPGLGPLTLQRWSPFVRRQLVHR